MHARFNTSLNRKLDTRFEELENVIKKLTQQVEQDNIKTKARIDETELNTLWKIKDFSDLLQQRPTTQYVDEQIKQCIASSKLLS
jgi:hypothetical protein